MLIVVVFEDYHKAANQKYFLDKDILKSVQYWMRGKTVFVNKGIFFISVTNFCLY